MKDLVIAVAVALSAALIIVAAAVYRTWTEDTMMIVTVAASLACLLVPAILTWIVAHHLLDERAAARKDSRLLAELQAMKHQGSVTLVEQRGQTEMLRAAKLLAGMQPPQISAPPANPWASTDAWDDDDDEEDGRAPLRL